MHCFVLLCTRRSLTDLRAVLVDALILKNWGTFLDAFICLYRSSPVFDIKDFFRYVSKVMITVGQSGQQSCVFLSSQEQTASAKSVPVFTLHDTVNKI